MALLSDRPSLPGICAKFALIVAENIIDQRAQAIHREAIRWSRAMRRVRCCQQRSVTRILP